MYKKIIFCMAITILNPINALVIDQTMLDNSPSAYLVDLADSINDAPITKQIGDELFSRDYISTVSVLDSQAGSFEDRPADPANGYSFSNGVWVWIPDMLGSTDGIWNWIERLRAAYLQFIYDNYVPF